MFKLQLIFESMKSNKSIDQYPEEIKFAEFPYNHEETQRLEAMPIYSKYKNWLKENGVILDPRIRYPSYFGSPPNGVIGISTSKAIERKKAVIAVPYELLITVAKVKQNKDLNTIINTSFSIFGKNEDYVMKILILYVVYEFLKKEKSFYHPYFSICLADYVQGWSKWSAYKIQHRSVMRDLKFVQEEIELEFMKFLRIFRIHQNVFPSNISNTEYKDLFEKAYYMITTRAFGWSLPSISLIPLADSLNHGNLRFLNHFVTNIDLQKDPKCDELKHRPQINLTILKDQYFTLNNQQLGNLRKEPKSKVLRFVEKHKQILYARGQNQNCKSKPQARSKQLHILYQQYKAGIHKLKNLHFYDSSCSQDNDTDQEEIYERQNQKQSFQLDDLSRVISQNKKKSEVSKLWKIYKQFEQSDDEDEEQQEDKSLPKLKNEQLKKEIQQKMNKNEDSSEIQSNQSSDDQQQFGWLEKSNIKKTYFVMNTQETIRQNEQIYNFYGRRSNKFLLLGYNFILKDNIYDSFGFRLLLDSQITSKVPASKLVQNGKTQNPASSRQIRLKRYRINKDLIHLCRSYAILWSKKQSKNCRICVPFDQQIENKTLQLYKQFISYFLKEYTTTLQEDEQEQESTKNYSEKVAISLRIQYKKILQEQMALVSKCFDFLKRWKVDQVQQFQQSEMVWVKRIKGYLIELQKASSL